MSDAERDAHIKEIVAKLLEEYTDLTSAIEKLQLRRSRVRAALLPLIAIEEDEPAEFSGSLADACRFVLQHREGSLTPPQVRDAVKALGYDLTKHENVMAAIHGVLKSLVDQGQVKPKEWKKEPGVTRYYWNPDVPPQQKMVPLASLGAMWTGAPIDLSALSSILQIDNKKPDPMDLKAKANEPLLPRILGNKPLKGGDK